MMYVDAIAQAGGSDAAARRRPVVSSSVLGMLIFIAAETMFFAGLLSAFVIGKANAIGWPPLGQPRAPVATTAFNTLLLLASVVPLSLAVRAFARAERGRRVRALLGATLALGAAFVVLQGHEWVRLVWFGLTMRSSSYGSFFYLVVGTHAMHAIGALVVLAVMARRLGRGTLALDSFRAAQMLWYFVVGLWPILYTLVYLL